MDKAIRDGRIAPRFDQVVDSVIHSMGQAESGIATGDISRRTGEKHVSFGFKIIPQNGGTEVSINHLYCGYGDAVGEGCSLL